MYSNIRILCILHTNNSSTIEYYWGVCIVVGGSTMCNIYLSVLLLGACKTFLRSDASGLSLCIFVCGYSSCKFSNHH